MSASPQPPTLRERLLRRHVGAAALLIPLLLKLLPLRWLLRLLKSPVPIYRAIAAERIAEIVNQRLARPRLMRRRACLRQGLLLFHFLRLAGYPAVIHFAVFPPAADPRRMHAHCWVALGGRPISDEPHQPHAVMLTFGQ